MSCIYTIDISHTTTALLDELFINQEAMHVQTKHWVDYGDPKTNQELQMGIMFEG